MRGMVVIVVPQVLHRCRNRGRLVLTLVLTVVLAVGRSHSPEGLQRQPDQQEKGQPATHGANILEGS